MMTASDLDLVKQYVRDGSETAFATLVERHLNLVYSAAMRQVRSPQLAEEVAQSVFTDLSQNAPKLKPDTVLTAWLYQVTRRTSVDVIRRESRRQLRERIAVEMTAMNADTAEWTQIEPLLDEAMDLLDENDRAAILLRYFENKSLREVGATLGTSDDTAQKRVSRAVDRLRDFFTRRGVAIGAGGLAAIISTKAVQAAPIELIVTISTAAGLAGTTVATTTATTAKAIAMTTLQKTLIATALAAALGTGAYEARQTLALRRQVQALQQQQSALAGQIERLRQERDVAARKLLGMTEENERLNRNTMDLPRLRAEVAGLRGAAIAPAQGAAQNNVDPTTLAAQAWVNRVKLLQQRFEGWPGKKTPELQLLTEQDWLNEAANHDLDSDEACRKSMGSLRTAAKWKLADAVNDGLAQFTSSNNGQLPIELPQLFPYVKPPVDLLLQGYEITKPGWVHPPKPNAPESERARVWAIVEKGSFTSAGVPIRDGSNLADPEYDMYVVIYQGGKYGYGVGKPAK